MEEKLMSLNETPSGERVHIGFFGRRNAGKSSVVNAVTGQELAVVSDTKGTTTDPVSKAMELLPIGPVVMIDTPGFDDEGKLGELRVRKTRQTLNKTDIAVLVTDCTLPDGECEKQLVEIFKEKNIPFIIVKNKCDLLENVPADGDNKVFISTKNRTGIEKLKETIAGLAPTDDRKRIVGDLIRPNDLVVLVTPIDTAAPKGRLILPQQQTIRDILDADACSVVVKEFELKSVLGKISKPALVITDSQAFARVSADVPTDIPLTSFSILMARYKGFLDTAVKGAAAIDRLKDGDKILISEGCTHHRQCDDIGTVKIPRWLKNYTGKTFEFSFSSGGGFPDDLSEYALIIHCGGCMLGTREITYRMKCAEDQNIPFTNYGVAIAFMQGILKRSVEIFPHLHDEL